MANGIVSIGRQAYLIHEPFKIANCEILVVRYMSVVMTELKSSNVVMRGSPVLNSMRETNQLTNF